MIVLDEHLSDPAIMTGISAWFAGQALPLNKLRPGSLIKDDAIPALLRKVSEPTLLPSTLPISGRKFVRMAISVFSPWW